MINDSSLYYEFLEPLRQNFYLHEDRIQARPFKVFFDVDDNVVDLPQLKLITKEMFQILIGLGIEKKYLTMFVLKSSTKLNYHIVFPWLVTNHSVVQDFYKKFQLVHPRLDIGASTKGQLRMAYQGSHKDDDSSVYELVFILEPDNTIVDSGGKIIQSFYDGNSTLNKKFTHEAFDTYDIREKNLGDMFQESLGFVQTLNVSHYTSLHFILDSHVINSLPSSNTPDAVRTLPPDAATVVSSTIDENMFSGENLLKLVKARNDVISLQMRHQNYDIKEFPMVGVIADEITQELQARLQYLNLAEFKEAVATVFNRYIILFFAEFLICIGGEIHFMAYPQLIAVFKKLTWTFGKKEFSALNIFINHPSSLQCTKYTFDPKNIGHNYPLQIYNSYKGLITTHEELAANWDEPNKAIALSMQKHIFTTICDENEDTFYFFMMNIAAKIRRPWIKLANCVILQGNQGAGKTIVGEWIGYLFGKYFYRCHDLNGLLGGQFSGELMERLFVLVDEAFLCDPRVCNKFKAWITEDHIALEKKYKDKKIHQNYLWFMLCTNEQKILPPGEQERRFVIIKTRRNQLFGNELQYEKYWEQILKYQRNDDAGLKCWLTQFTEPNFISDTDLDAFGTGRELPVSSLKNMLDQKLLNIGTVGQFWKYVLDRGWIYNPMTDYVTCDIKSDFMDHLNDNDLQRFLAQTNGRLQTDLIGTNNFGDRRALHKSPNVNGIVFWWYHWQSVELIFQEYQTLRKTRVIEDSRYSAKNLASFLIETKKYFDSMFSNENQITFTFKGHVQLASSTRYRFDDVQDQQWTDYLHGGDVGSNISSFRSGYAYVGSLQSMREKFQINAGLKEVSHLSDAKKDLHSRFREKLMGVFEPS